MTSGEEEKKKTHTTLGLPRFFLFSPLPSAPPLILLSLFCGARERERREAKKRHFSLFSFHFSAKVEGGGGGFKPPPSPFFPFRLSRLRIIGVRWKEPKSSSPPFHAVPKRRRWHLFSFFFFSSFPPVSLSGWRQRANLLPPPNKKTGWCVIMAPL